MKPESEIHSILQGLARVDEMLEWPSDRLYVLVESVSGWSPAQQVEHLLLTLQRIGDIIAGLESGTDERIQRKGSPRLMARALLVAGRIPRGRAEAPDFVRPEATPGRAGLRDRHTEVRTQVEARAGSAGSLSSIPGTIPHPLLGCFSALQWLRFGRIHTDHHLAIIDDIDRMRAVGEPLPDSPLPVHEQP